MKTILPLFLLLVSVISSNAQSSTPVKTSEHNPLLCNPEKGMCELPGEHNHGNREVIDISPEKKIKVVYFTDPICSSCWGIEFQLKKLKLEYGEILEIEYRMGGLLPDWNYNSGGISKPSDVAHHWDEMSTYYNMPIDGDVWLEDPLPSSYPPSIAFKAAQLQDEQKALLFLRKMREMVFLQKKNIAKWEHISKAAVETGLDTVQLKKDVEATATKLFQADLELARQMGVRGFPTMFFIDSLNNYQIVYGSKSYETFEDVVLKLHPMFPKKNYERTWEVLFSQFHSLSLREFIELSGLDTQTAEWQLDILVRENRLFKITCKNGSVWRLKDT